MGIKAICCRRGSHVFNSRGGFSGKSLLWCGKIRAAAKSHHYPFCRKIAFRIQNNGGVVGALEFLRARQAEMIT